MSLINDALRRAGQNQVRNPHDMIKLNPTQKEPPPRPASGGGSGMKVVLTLIIIAGAAYGGWFYWTKYKNPPSDAKAGVAGKSKSDATASADKPKLTTNNNPIARATATLMKVKQLNTEGENTADQIQSTATKAPASAPTQTPVAQAPAGSKPWSTIPGMPRLQAIFYKPTDPTALIDGKIVKAGEEIGGAKVVEVKKSSVRMQLGSDVHEVTIK
jgi:sRNA-binding protein